MRNVAGRGWRVLRGKRAGYRGVAPFPGLRLKSRPGLLPRLLPGLLLGLLAHLPPAWAIIPPPSFSCSFSVSAIDFGNVNVITGAGINTSGSISISCKGGSAYNWVTICPNIEYGSGNPSAWNPRQMDSGGNKLNYNLYHPGTFTIWGSFLWAHSARPPVLRYRLDSSGRGNWTTTIDARIASGQTAAAPGFYVSSFSGSDVKFDYRMGYSSSCALPDGTESPPFQVRANVIAYCEVSATDIDFGTAGVLDANVDSTGQISVRCTNGTPYQVKLNGGLAGAGSPDQRRMTKGSESVRYGIYRDSARTQGWGDQPGNVANGTGNGNAQVFTTYGRVFPQTTPSPGTYTDTVVVTVVY